MDVSRFSFANRQVTEPMVRQIHSRDFIECAEDVVLIGDIGTGKIHQRPP